MKNVPLCLKRRNSTILKTNNKKLNKLNTNEYTIYVIVSYTFIAKIKDRQIFLNACKSVVVNP